MNKFLTIIILLLLSYGNAKANCATGTIADPVVDSITVDLAGNVTICWQPIADPDLDYYAIYMYNTITGANDSIDEVAAGGNCFTLPAAFNNSDFEITELRVYAYDICDNVGASEYYNTMWLDYGVDICAASIDLTWNPYDDFNSGTTVQYNVYVSINSGPYTFLGNTLTTNYTFSGIVQGNTYDFFVRAYENNGAGPISSSSNDVQINSVNFLKDPLFNYLYTATVIDSQEIDVQFYVDTAADVSHYNIKRRTSLSEAYVVINTISAYNGMNPLVSYFDYDVDTKNTHYYYEIETINTCGDLKFTSNVGKTIWLRAESDSVGEKNTLTITKYEDWLGGIDKYEIYRAIGGVWDVSPIAILSPFGDTTIYEDNIMTITEGNGEFCYKVVATERNIAHVGGLPKAESTSNESCVIHSPLLYVPNAFAPLSIYNPTFKPVLTFSNPAGYLFQIFNRWGQKIFETTDLTVGWNGAFENSGKMCPGDTYVYKVNFMSSDGEEYKKTGVVTLLN